MPSRPARVRGGSDAPSSHPREELPLKRAPCPDRRACVPSARYWMWEACRAEVVVFHYSIPQEEKAASNPEPLIPACSVERLHQMEELQEEPPSATGASDLSAGRRRP